MSTTAGRWTKLHDSLIDGDALALTRDARLLGVEAEAWSDRQETDGRIPGNALRRITDAEAVDPLVAELVAAGRWTATEAGFQIEGFLDRHDSAAEREVGKEANAARLKGWRQHQVGRHNAAGPRPCSSCTAVRNSVSNGVRNATRSEARRSDSEAEAEASSDSQARSAASPPPASAAALARAGRPLSPEHRAKIAAAHARRRAEREAMAKATKEKRERDQRERDEEWLRLGGSPDALPVSFAQLEARKYPGRRPLR
jgi:hypothetical protein